MAHTGMVLRHAQMATETINGTKPREDLAYEYELNRRRAEQARDDAKRAALMEAWREYREWDREAE